MELRETRAYRREEEFAAAVAAIEKMLAPDVVRLRYELGEDWAGDPAVFFRVTAKNEVFREGRSAGLSQYISEVINRELEPREEWDVRFYDRFRSVAEQERLQEPAWA